MLSLSARTSKLWGSILASLGLVLLLAGAIMMNIFPGILDKKIKQNLILSEGTPTYEKWVESPVPIYLRIYLFNVTNPEDVMAKKKPILQEIGPFTYIEKRKKIVTGWDSEKGTVHYINRKIYEFQPDLSYGDEDTNITSINIPYLSLAKIISKKLSVFLKPMAYNILNRYPSTLFITHSVREWLFDGIPIQPVEDIKKAIQSVVNVDSLKTRFGFLYQKNGSLEEYYSVFTGEKGIDNYTSVSTFLNESSLPHWSTPYCNMLNGTDGKQFPFPLNKSDLIYVFSPELCRSLHLEYEQDVDVHGITAYRYTARARLFGRIPENLGFCTDPKDCPRSGIHQIARCKKGAPIFISGPHFYLADPYYGAKFEGLNPNKEDHETRLDVEPQTGITVQARRRIQIGVESESFYSVLALRKAPEAAFPVMWTEQAATIPPHLAAAFLSKVKRPAVIAHHAFIAAIALGLILVLVAVFLVFTLVVAKNPKKKTNEKKNVMPMSYTPLATGPQENDHQGNNEKPAIA